MEGSSDLITQSTLEPPWRSIPVEKVTDLQAYKLSKSWLEAKDYEILPNVVIHRVIQF
jgi:hypothetical protein